MLFSTDWINNLFKKIDVVNKLSDKWTLAIKCVTVLVILHINSQIRENIYRILN